MRRNLDRFFRIGNVEVTFRSKSGNVAAITASGYGIMIVWQNPTSPADLSECDAYLWETGIKRLPTIPELLREVWRRMWRPEWGKR